MGRKVIATFEPISDIGTYILTGTGIGKKRYLAQIKFPNEDMIETNAIDVTDCIYYDDMSVDTTSNYYGRNGSLSYVRDTIIFTVTGTSNTNVQLGTGNGVSNPSDYVGKTIRFECHIKPSKSCRIQIYQYVDRSYVNTVSSNIVTYETDLSIESTISSGATRVLLRIDCPQGVSGDTVEFKDFKVYPFGV